LFLGAAVVVIASTIQPVIDLHTDAHANERLKMPAVLELPPRQRTVQTVFVLLAMGVPPLFVLLVDRAFAAASLSLAVMLQIAYCVLAVGLLAGALRAEGSPVASLGVRRPDWSTFALAIGLLALVQFVLTLLTTPVVRFFGNAAVDAQVATLARLPVWFRCVMAISGGAIEEALYRGYATDRLVRVTGSRWFGGGLAALGFGLAHIPAWGGVFALAADLPMGVMMTFAYIWRRDLVANALAHSAGLLIGMAFV
jgi:membrane protease YdiL (CAAX protease family)